MIRWLHAAHCSVPDADRDRQELVADAEMVHAVDGVLVGQFRQNLGMEVSERDRMMNGLELLGGPDAAGGGFGIVGLTRDTRIRAPVLWFAVCLCIRVPATGMRENARFAHVAVGRWEDSEASEYAVLGAAIAAALAAESGGLAARYYTLYVNRRRRGVETGEPPETTLDSLVEYFAKFESSALDWTERLRRAEFRCSAPGPRSAAAGGPAGDYSVGASESAPVLAGCVAAALMIRSLRNEERQLARNVFCGVKLQGSARSQPHQDSKRVSGDERLATGPARDGKDVSSILLRRALEEPPNVVRVAAEGRREVSVGGLTLASWRSGSGLEGLDRLVGDDAAVPTPANDSHHRAYSSPSVEGDPTRDRILAGLSPIRPPVGVVGVSEERVAVRSGTSKLPEWDALATLRTILARGSPGLKAGTRECVEPVLGRGPRGRLVSAQVTGDWIACVCAPPARGQGHQLVLMRFGPGGVEYCWLPCWLQAGNRPTTRPPKLDSFGESVLQSLPNQVDYLADNSFVWGSEDALRQVVVGDLWAAVDEDPAPGRAGEVDCPRAIRDGVTLLLMNRSVERRLYALLGDRPDSSRSPYARCILPDFRPEGARRFRDSVVAVSVALDEQEFMDTVDRAREYPLDRFLLASHACLGVGTNPVPDRDYDTHPLLTERVQNPFVYRGDLRVGWTARDLRTGVLEALTLPAEATGELTRFDVSWYRYSGGRP